VPQSIEQPKANKNVSDISLTESPLETVIDISVPAADNIPIPLKRLSVVGVDLFLLRPTLAIALCIAELEILLVDTAVVILAATIDVKLDVEVSALTAAVRVSDVVLAASVKVSDRVLIVVVLLFAIIFLLV
jgi:hypothetical protein